MRLLGRKNILACGSAIAVLALASGACAQQRTFDIQANNAVDAIPEFARQAGVQIVAPASQLSGVRTPALRGEMDAREALRRLIAGAGLEVASDNGSVITLRRVAGPQVAGAPEPPAEVTEVMVTGTRVRGAVTPSPVVTVGAERIRQEGFTDLGEVIRSLPQNFTGGQNPGVLMGNIAGGGLANQNVSGGSALNLRGLGPDASLTLLNGRRMSYGGIVQAVDISAIPLEAVERIDVVADGASAIYGSDAVGGVANVILKRGFDGVALGARYGGATDGGLTTREYTATVGATWNSGGFLATYKDESVDPIYARQRDYTAHIFNPATIYAGSKSHSSLFSGHQWIDDSIKLNLDVVRNERDQLNYYYLSVTSRYNLQQPAVTTSLIIPSVDFLLPNDWRLSVYAAWGRDELIEDQKRIDVATAAVTQFVYGRYLNTSRTYDVGAEGPLFSLGGREARLALGAGYRKNEFAQDNLITGVTAMGTDEASRFVYAEVNLPLIDPQSDLAFAKRLSVTAAVRSEDYESFGRVTTPKLGLVYDPSDDFTVKASWGRSFKAPTLFQRSFSVGAALVLPAAYGGTGYTSGDTVFRILGGNPNLEPERARTSTATLDFHPKKFPGLEAELTWFDIEYADRVVQPILSYSVALSNPNLAEFVDYSPTAAQLAEFLAIAASFTNSTGLPYDPSRVVAIVDGRFVNATRQRIKGIDVSGSYRFDFETGQLVIRGSANWLDSTQKTKGTPAPYDLAGTLHNPAKFRSRIGASWNGGSLSASTFVNYTGGVTNTSDGRKGGSFTTLDATLRYSPGEQGRAWSGLDFALTATNLLDRTPPLYLPATNAAFVAPYDSTSYSAIGRFLSFSVSKRW